MFDFNDPMFDRYRFCFYYDESEHSRKITPNTVLANNYCDNFLTVIVGWTKEKEESILDKYSSFEDKYKDRKSNNELKSTTLKQKFFENGFASMDKVTTSFVGDFLSLFDENIKLYVSSYSKIEYIIAQTLSDFNDTDLNKNCVIYTITKAIVLYHPKDVIESICCHPESFIPSLRNFLIERIKINQSNTTLKRLENDAFLAVIAFLDQNSVEIKYQWSYCMPFYGLRSCMMLEGIQPYSSLTIDKEGCLDQESKTLQAAKQMFLVHSKEADSSTCLGIRIADIMAGILSKLQRSMYNFRVPSEFDEYPQKIILSSAWFKLNENQLNLYKTLHKILRQWNPVLYKIYSGVYADDTILMLKFLDYINQFESSSDLAKRLDHHGGEFNLISCKYIASYFENSLPFIRYLINKNQNLFLPHYKYLEEFETLDCSNSKLGLFPL